MSKAAAARAASAGSGGGGGFAAGIELRRPDRPADPEALDRGVAPGLGRVVGEEPGGARLGQVGGDLRIVGAEAGAVEQVAPAGSSRSPNGSTRPMTVTISPGSIRASA